MHSTSSAFTHPGDAHGVHFTDPNKSEALPCSCFFSHFVISIVQGLTVFVINSLGIRLNVEKHMSQPHHSTCECHSAVVNPAAWHHVEGNQQKNGTLWN